MIQTQNILLSLLVTALSTVMCVSVLRRIAAQAGLLDRPGGRKQHSHPTPLVGGLAMFAALSMTWVVFPGVRPDPSVWLGFVVLVVFGAIDDRSPLAARFKLLVQSAVAASVVLLAGLSLPDVGELLPGWSPQLGAFAAPFAVFAILSVMNGINMADGVDGLSGSLALTAFAALAVGAGLAGGTNEPLALAIAGFALLGFLAFNLPVPGGRPARIFMGDAGTLSIGFLLACFALWVTNPAGLAVPHAVALWACAVSLIDGLSVILGRLARGVRATDPGRDHLHHILMSRGFSVPAVLLIEVGLAAILATAAILGWQLGVPEWVLSLTFLFAAAIYFFWYRHAMGGTGRFPPTACGQSREVGMVEPVPARPVGGPALVGITEQKPERALR